MIGNEVNLAKSAAASAGMISSGKVVESRPTTDAARIPTKPANTVPITVLLRAMSDGDSPASSADLSFSDAALVARPNRVYR